MARADEDTVREPGGMSHDIADMNKKGVQTLVAIQKEALHSCEMLQGEFIKRAQTEAKVTADFAASLMSSRSPTDVAAAYRSFITERFQLCAADGRWLLANSQKCADMFAKALGNGRDLAKGGSESGKK